MTGIVGKHLKQEVAQDIGLLLRDFQKLIKVISLYPEDNPLPLKMRDSVGQRFMEMVQRYGGFKFDIRPSSIIYDGESVYEDLRKEEALADVFYKAGIVTLEFKNDLAENELILFLDALKEYFNQPITERDLVTLLWQEQFGGIRFSTIEDATLGEFDADSIAREFRSNYAESHNDSNRIEFGEIALDLEDEQTSSSDSSTTSAEMAEAARNMGLSLDAKPDQDGKIELLIKEIDTFSEEEQRQIYHLLQENRHVDNYRAVTRILVEILHIWKELKPFSETASICEKILNELLLNGAFAIAADFVHSIRNLHDRLGVERMNFRVRLDDFLRWAGDRERVERLTDIINQQETVDTNAIEIYLESLGWESLVHITEMLGRLVSKNARFMVCDHLARHGRDRLSIIGNGVRDKRWYVVRNTVMILGGIGGNQILDYLTISAQHYDKRVRAETVNVLAELDTEAAIEMLCRFLEDPDSELRILCLKHLEKAGGRTAFENIWKIVNSDKFENYSLEEQQWFLIALSRLGGEEVVDILARVVGTLRIFAPAHSMRYRLAALTALVHNRSDAAEQAILKFTCSRRKWLREAASAALEQRRKIIFGGGDDDVN